MRESTDEKQIMMPANDDTANILWEKQYQCELYEIKSATKKHTLATLINWINGRNDKEQMTEERKRDADGKNVEKKTKDTQ